MFLNCPTFFAHPFFLFLPCPPQPSPGNFLPQNPLFLGPQINTLSRREKATTGFWGRFWTGSSHRKKRKILFFWRAKPTNVHVATLTESLYHLRCSFNRHWRYYACEIAPIARESLPLGKCGGVKQGRFVIFRFPLLCSVWGS